MRKIGLFIVTVLLSACENSDGVKVLKVQGDKTKPVTSSIWQAADSGRFYYDLRASGEYYTFLDDKSDTLIRVYKRHESNVIYNYYVKANKSILNSKLQFLKYNSRYENVANRSFIVQDASIRASDPGQPTGQILSEPIATPLGSLPNSVDYCITSDEIYAAPLNTKYSSPYYLYRPDSGYLRVEAYKHPGVKYPKAPLAYRTNLTVNPEQKRLVSAQRFMNDVLFYDLQGNIKTVVTFGKGHIMPEIKENEVDIIGSLKCFIYVCGTEQHVYCLYDGSYDYTAKSMIVVFDWEGLHISTLKTDRSLKQIAVNSDETEIIALAANDSYGRDVVVYKLQ